MRSNVEWYMLGGGLIGFAMLIVLGIFFILPLYQIITILSSFSNTLTNTSKSVIMSMWRFEVGIYYPYIGIV